MVLAVYLLLKNPELYRDLAQTKWFLKLGSKR
jgi:hypothetical protein